MTRSRTIRVVGTAIIVFGLGALPARATTITLDYSSDVDLSTAVGSTGAASNTLSFSVTWDPSTAPDAGSTATLATYHNGFTFNDIMWDGVAVSQSAGSEILLVSLGGANDQFNFVMAPVGMTSGNVTINDLVGRLELPVGTFSSDALPQNLNFLNSTNVGITLYQDLTFGNFNGTLTPSAPVPEPATLSLTALGLAGVVRRYRRRWTQ